MDDLERLALLKAGDSGNLYLKKDLIDHADVDNITSTYQREDALGMALPPEADIHVSKTGGYQGELAIVIDYDGYIWMSCDHYGSCSHCDPFIDNERDYIEKVLREIHCFPNVESAYQYLQETDSWEWNNAKGVAEKLLTRVADDAELAGDWSV